MPRNFWSRPWLLTTCLTVLAGAFYCSWPLAYWLNPVANRGLASNLEATGQPYNWVFIGLDIVSGLLICGVTWWLLQALKRPNMSLKIALYGFGAFGLFTAVDALLPINCLSVVQRCGPVLHDPWMVIHGAFSLASIGALTLSILSLWWLLVHDRRAAMILRWLLHGTVLAWFAFGLVTFVLLVLVRSSALSQHLFIIVCSLWTAALPYLVWEALEKAGSFSGEEVQLV